MTILAGFAPVFSSRHFATSSRRMEIEVKSERPRTEAV